MLLLQHRCRAHSRVFSPCTCFPCLPAITLLFVTLDARERGLTCARWAAHPRGAFGTSTLPGCACCCYERTHTIDTSQSRPRLPAMAELWCCTVEPSLSMLHPPLACARAALCTRPSCSWCELNFMVQPYFRGPRGASRPGASLVNPANAACNTATLCVTIAAAATHVIASAQGALVAARWRGGYIHM